MNADDSITSSIAAPDVAALASTPRLRGWLSRLVAILAPREATQPHACNAFRQQNDGNFACVEYGAVIDDVGDLPP